jgi:O-acetyl-ADP-ribose deacetylase
MQLQFHRGDLTAMAVDAIVNAANSSLMGGGGVDGAIHRKGGPAILEDCKRIVADQGELPTGQAVITTAGDLSARHVIHTVGPVWHGGSQGEAEQLADCYLHSLQLAAEHGLRSVAFPNISTGVYRFPKAQAAQIAIDTVQAFAQQHTGPIEEVIFVCFDAENAELYEERLG